MKKPKLDTGFHYADKETEIEQMGHLYRTMGWEEFLSSSSHEMLRVKPLRKAYKKAQKASIALRDFFNAHEAKADKKVSIAPSNFQELWDNTAGEIAKSKWLKLCRKTWPHIDDVTIKEAKYFFESKL